MRRDTKGIGGMMGLRASRFRATAMAAALCTAAAACVATGGGARPPVGDLRKVASAHGLPRPLVQGKAVALKNGRSLLSLEIGSRRLIHDGVLLWMNSPLVRSGRRLLLRDEDIRSVLTPLLRPGAAFAGRKTGLVVLDPGHGGSDEGAKGRGETLEKTLTLDLARRAREMLREAGANAELTRDSDKSMSLTERVEQARRLDACVFVSIHLNWGSRNEAAGFETYVLPPAGPEATSSPGNANDGANTILGYCIQKALIARATGEDRGVKRARFVVLRDSRCPAALVECGFISNSEDLSHMLEPAYRDMLAGAVCTGILDYFALAEKAHGGIDSKP